jgi:pilus assembly protein CpaB
MNWQRLAGGLAVSLVVGLLAGVFVFTQFKKLAQAKSVPTVPVVVTARAIPLGTRLQPSDLRVVSWPAAHPVQGACSKIEDCANRAVITSLVENEPLLNGKLAPKEGGAGLSATIPTGMRAVTVSVNDVIGVAGFVVPGTMVDVLVTGTMGSGNVTRTILENIRVLAVGQKVEADRESKPQTPAVITLLVSPEEANELAMAATQGRIQLALRNTLDSAKVDPAPVMQAALFGAPQASAPAVATTAKKARAPEKPKAAAVPETYNVEVIRGAKKEEATFPAPEPQ